MPINKSISPLRYPGGKSCLTGFISDMANLNNLQSGTYVELYAGGAGAALNLLFNGVFANIHINDYDYQIYSMWYSILYDTEKFITKILEVDVNLEEWFKQKHIYDLGKNSNIFDLGFATFFLNRTNRSGIIYKAGPIGGFSQLGSYKINCRFNKLELVKRISSIANKRDNILLTNLDAIEIIKNINLYHDDLDKVFLYLDPPYFKKGKYLYLNNYSNENHLTLADDVGNYLNNVKWLISYDNTPEIVEMYKRYRMSTFDLNYTLQSKKFGSELLVFSNNLNLNDTITVNNRTNELTLI